MIVRDFMVTFMVIMACYLMLTLPVASAFLVSTYTQAGSKIGTSISLDPSSLILRTVTVVAGNDPKVNIGITNSTPSVTVDKTIVYLCKGNDPTECAEDTATGKEQYSGNVNSDISWSRVADSAGPFPHTGTVLTFVKVNNGGVVSWQGFLTEITRTSVSAFQIREEQISEARVYAEDISMVNAIREFISSRLMIPMNPDWVNRISIQGAGSVHEIEFSDESELAGLPSSQEVSGEVIISITDDYAFEFKDDGLIWNPVTLYSNPTYTCGLYGCESEEHAETSENCCLDCGCSSGYYCDSDDGCRLESLISLSPFGSFNPTVSNCYESHTIDVPVEIGNAPSGYTISSSMCRIGGGTFDSCACEKGDGDVFVCTVSVPPVAECGTGEFRLTDNSIRITIGYLNGSAPVVKALETDFSDITVGSFTCGQGGCEIGLNEDSTSCCFDCGCAGKYCDYKAGNDPGTGQCKGDPTATDIELESMNPTHFAAFAQGSQVDMVININDRPKTMDVTNVICSLGCMIDGSEGCTATCSVTKGALSSSDPTVYNLSVTLGLNIDGFDPGREYRLSPTLTFDIRYLNGSAGYVETTIEKEFPRISTGEHYCGDGNCIGDESSSDCCYDCGCSSGYYCDTLSTAGHTEGDSCKEESFSLIIDHMDSVDPLSDSVLSHDISLAARIQNYPSGMEAAEQCTLADGNVTCTISCEKAASADAADYNMTCGFSVPAMAFYDSPHYDPVTRKITLEQNIINLTVSYNDGPESVSGYITRAFGPVVVDVITHCGDDDCESDIGEGWTSCCYDCGCDGAGSDYFCHHSSEIPNGICVQPTDMSLHIIRFAPYPIPTCLVGRIGGDCKFIKAVEAHVNITNQPPDMVLLSGFHEFGDGEPGEIDKCIKGDTFGEWVCSFIPDDVRNPALGAFEKDFSIGLSISYNVSDGRIVDSLNASKSFTLYQNKSTKIIQCEEKIEQMDDSIKRLESNRDEYGEWGKFWTVLGGVMIAAGIALIIFGMTVYCAPHCALYVMAGIALVGMGTGMIALGQQSSGTGDNLELQISSMEDQRDEMIKMCSSKPFEETAAIAGNLTTLPPVVIPDLPI